MHARAHARSITHHKTQNNNTISLQRTHFPAKNQLTNLNFKYELRHSFTAACIMHVNERNEMLSSSFDT